MNNIKTLTFQEVQHELNKESLFIKGDFDVEDFRKKGDFLTNIGFENSIATKLYNSISNGVQVINNYKVKYPNYKFILEPQLERVCEKYDLYVRPLEFFLGDIPEKNVQDLMNFKVDYRDIAEAGQALLNIYHKLSMNSYSFNGNANANLGYLEKYKDVYLHSFGDIKFELAKVFNLDTEFFSTEKRNHAPNLNGFLEAIGCDVDSDSVYDNPIYGGLEHIPKSITIASVKKLLSSKAFESSDDRLIKVKHQLNAKNKVELDPIVLCKVNHGYLIITAWGDEANDELVLNQINN